MLWCSISTALPQSLQNGWKKVAKKALRIFLPSFIFASTEKNDRFQYNYRFRSKTILQSSNSIRCLHSCAGIFFCIVIHRSGHHTLCCWNIFTLFCCPLAALFDSCAGRIISMLWVTRILLQQIARKSLALTAMDDSPILATQRHRTFSMEGVAIGCNTPATVARRFITADLAAQTASCIDHPHTSSVKPRRTG